MKRPIHLLIATLLVAIAIKPATAQDALPRHFSAKVGVFQYELSRSGLAPMVAFRTTVPTSSVLVLEGGLVASRPRQQIEGNTLFLAPEIQAQMVLPFERYLPYMGLGAGAVIDFRGDHLGGMYANFSVSASLGIRAWVLDRGGFQVEFRGRGIGADFAETSSEYTIGMIWRI